MPSFGGSRIIKNSFKSWELQQCSAPPTMCSDWHPRFCAQVSVVELEPFCNFPLNYSVLTNLTIYLFHLFYVVSHQLLKLSNFIIMAACLLALLIYSIWSSGIPAGKAFACSTVNRGQFYWFYKSSSCCDDSAEGVPVVNSRLLMHSAAALLQISRSFTLLKNCWLSSTSLLRNRNVCHDIEDTGIKIMEEIVRIVFSRFFN